MKTKVPECCSGLCPSEKELPEQRSNAFHHKDTLDHYHHHHHQENR
jgi:hypothetical protein